MLISPGWTQSGLHSLSSKMITPTLLMLCLMMVSACSLGLKQSTIAANDPPTADTAAGSTLEPGSEPIPSASSSSIAANANLRTLAPDPLLEGLNADDIAKAQALAKRDYLKHWEVIAERSRYVRERVLAAIEALHAPSSLQLIPIVESGYNAYALSHAGAMGLWQLMPRTAQALGLHSDRWRDGRRDVERSTRAAIRYLLDLHQRFNSWPLAIAAYHIGPYGLARRLERTPWQAADGLDALPVPSVTRAYVRHVLGLAALLKMGILSFPEPYATAAIELRPPVDLVKLSLACGMRRDEIFLFNPGLNQAQYLTHRVRIHLPAERLSSIKQQLETLRPRYVKTTVRKGDSLWRIAHRHGISLARLKRLNPHITGMLRPGQKLTIPAERLARATASPNPLLSRGRRIRYKVRKGDSLWRIARRFGTSPAAIARLNRLSRNSVIRPGEFLWVIAHIRPS